MPMRENCYICYFRVKTMSKMFIFIHVRNTVPTQNIQGALVVGDNDKGSLCLQMLPAAHFNSKTQDILHMTNHDADNPDGRKEINNYRPNYVEVPDHSHVSM